MPHTACPSKEQLVAFHKADLPEGLLTDIEAHLEEECPDCEGVLTDLERQEHPVFSLLRRHPPVLLTGQTSPAVQGASTIHDIGTRPARLPVNKYELLRELGHGGMGVVYLARQVKAKRTVAIKMIRPSRDTTVEEKVRFRIEAEAIARLQHPNIVQLYEVDEHEGTPFLLLEFIEGGNLAERLRSGVMPAREAAALVEKLARAMHYAHARGILHRDLKPANVLLTTDGEPKITDFGLAKRLDDDAGQTQTGAVMGTPSYMAPEQAEGRTQEFGPPTDVYALGILLYECLTGKPPFQGSTSLDTLLKIKTEEPVPPSCLARKVPRDLERICLKGLAKEPKNRYASALELAEDLRRFQAGYPIKARPIGRLARSWRWCRRNPLIAGLLAAVLLLFAGGFSLVTWKWLEATEQRERAEANARAEKASRERAQASLYFSTIHLADREWRADQTARAEELLDQCPGHLRHWEWHYLKRLCHTEIRTFPGSPGPDLAVAFSPVGRKLASASRDKTVRIWDWTTGRLLHTLRGHTQWVTDVVFNPDGRWVASAGEDGLVKVWDANMGRELHSLQGAAGETPHLTFSPDGIHLASGGSTKSVRVWNAATGKEVFALAGHTGDVTCVAFSPKGHLLASGSTDTTVKIWEARTGQLLRTFTGHARRVECVAFSPDGLHLASVNSLVDSRQNNKVEVMLWEVATGEVVWKFPPQVKEISSLAFSPDGKRLALASAGHRVTFWDTTEREELFVLRDQGNFGRVAFSPDGRWLASGGMSLKLWDATRAQTSISLNVPPYCAAFALAYSPDGKRLALADGDGHVKLCDAGTGHNMTHLKGHQMLVHAVAYRPDGRRLASASRDETVKVWDPGTGKALLTLHGHKGHVNGVAYSPDGRRLASAGNDHTVRLWNADTGREIRVLRGHRHHVLGVVFSPDGKHMASASFDRTVKVWEADTGHERLVLRSPPGQSTEEFPCLAFSPDSRRLAAGSGGGNPVVYVWEVKTGKELAVCRGHTRKVTSVAFSPDGKRIVSASDDKKVRLWEAATGREVLTLHDFRNGVNGAVFSPNGRRIAAAGFERSVRIWDATPLSR